MDVPAGRHCRGGLTPIIFYLASTNNFRWLRLVAFINPESDPTGSSYQIVNSKITIGSGGLYGKGAWAEGTLTHLNYVPENHTDFIFSVVGETLGFVGSSGALCVRHLPHAGAGLSHQR